MSQQQLLEDKPQHTDDGADMHFRRKRVMSFVCSERVNVVRRVGVRDTD